ncbi:MAG: hypothetical protein J5382_07260 [Bacteroidales bacterium]|nr:hypothetical protein [Bacteroidales bacterium]
MINKLHILLMAVVLASACSNMDTDHPNPWNSDPGEDDTPIVFLSETDHNAWAHLGGLEERFSACEVSPEVLNAKTTRALGLSILHYPLNGIVYSYNYWDMPVKMIYDRSSLHQALAARKDAATVLIDIFDMTRIDINLMFSSDYEVISLLDEVFLELFLGTRLVPGLDSNSNKERLKTIVSRKMTERKADSLFSNSSLIPLAYMNERLGLGIKFDDNIVEMMHMFTLGDSLFDNQK